MTEVDARVRRREARESNPPDRVSDPGPAVSSSTTIVATAVERADDPADRWLVLLRWLAVTGMAVTILAANAFVDGLETSAMMSVLLAIGASNLVWLALLSKAVRGTARDGRRYVEAQLGVDVLLLALMLWFAGGISNPFASFLTFQIALAGLLCTPRATLVMAALTIVAVVVLTLAPPLPPLSPLVSAISVAVALSSLSAIVAAFVAVYARRLSRLRDESARNEKLAVLGRLVGSMSHELNTPLATILLLSRDLKQFRNEMPAEEVEELVSSIASEAERANDIIGLVRGHVGSDQAVEPVELCAFVEQHANAELDRLGFEGERRFSLAGPITVPVMRRALVQVLANLLRNACEASLLGGSRRIVIAVGERNGVAEIAVEDRGPGFRPEVLSRLGEPFQTTKGNQGGMGLGLYVSAQLAKQMGAKLAVESRDRGARVVLSIDPTSTEHPSDAVGAGS